MLSNEDIQEFKDLYKKHFGEDLSDAEALESATKLIELVRVVYKSAKREMFDKGLS